MAHDASIATYSNTFDSSSERERVTESHQKPRTNWTRAAPLCLDTFTRMPKSARNLAKDPASASTLAAGVPMRAISSTCTTIGRVRAPSDRAMPITTSEKKILNEPGRPFAPKSPHTCQCNHETSSSSSGWDQAKIKKGHSSGESGSNGNAASTSSTDIWNDACRRRPIAGTVASE